MNRPCLRGSLFLTLAALAFPATSDTHQRDRFEVVEATISDIQHDFCSGALTPEDLVRMYLARIAAYDGAGPRLNSFMHVNENAVADARALKLDDFDGEDSEDPANRGANIAARAGHPSIAVPGGFMPNPAVPPHPFTVTPFPAGFNAKDAPYAVTFSGPAFSEAKLIGYTYAFEQATHHRVPPSSTPPLSATRR